MSVKFSQFNDETLLLNTDIVVGLRGVVNAQFPIIGIGDSAGNKIITWTQTAGTNTNWIDFANSNTGVAPTINAKGNDVNVNLSIGAQGSGHVFFSGTGAIGVPSGTTGQQPVGFVGGFRYNTTTNFLEYWDAGTNAWVDVINGAALAGLTYVTQTNETADLPNSFRLVGTANRLTATYVANVLTLDISAAYVGQTSITTLGTITTGVWNGTAINETHGGTNQTTYTLGDTLYASAANTLSKLAGNITSGIQYLSQTGTGAVSAAPVWSTISGGDITGAALTKVDDTNVTLTLGGTPATALLRAASITAGWTGQLSFTRGGTNASLTASNGGLVYSTATALAILSGTATANQIPLSGSNAAPSWSTATYPATTTINQLLYSSAANTIAGLATANSASLITTNAGVPVFSSTMTNGQIIIGSTGATPVAASLTAGSGVTITPGAGTITISATGSGGTVTNVSGVAPIASTGGTTPAISLNGTATAGQVLQSVTATTTAYSTPTYPSASGSAGKILRADGTNNVYSTATFADTYTASNLLYSNGSNTVTGLATANSAALVTNSTGVPIWSSTMTNGQVIIGSTGATPVAASLTAGSGVTITPGAGTITIAATGSGGSVTSVGLSVSPSGAGSVSGSPVTTSGTLALTIKGALLNVRYFTSGTGATYTPTTGTTQAIVQLKGGGGGGGGTTSTAVTFGAAAGGGGGAFVQKYITGITGGYTGTYTIGTGGAGGAVGNNAGANGNNSTYTDGTVSLTAGGGLLGNGGASTAASSATLQAAPGGGGTATGGDVNLNGGVGGFGITGNIVANLAVGGFGGQCGNSPGGPSGVASTATPVAGGTGPTNGGGGGGGGASLANTTGAAGGNGAAGVLIIYEFS